MESLNTNPLYEAMQDATTFTAPRDAGAYDSFYSRLSSLDFVAQNLRNMANGGGVIEDLPPFETSVSLFNGTCQIQAHILQPTYEAADGVGIQNGGMGGASTGSSATNTTAVEIGATAGVKSGDAKTGTEGSAGVSAKSTDGATHGTTGSWAGTGTAGTAPTASARFRCGVRFTVTVTIDHQPRTWASAVTLGHLDEHKVTKSIDAYSNGIVRLPVARCVPIA